MAFLGQTFDANNVEPASEFVPVPPGKYLVQIIDSEMKDTSSGGQMLVLTMEILDGECAGRKLFDRLNIVNANETAQKIAYQTLSAICHAIGVMSLSDSNDLHFKPLVASVKVRPPRTDPKTGKEYGAGNEISGYSAASGAAPTQAARPAYQAQRPAATAPAQAQRAPSAAPWKRSA